MPSDARRAYSESRLDELTKNLGDLGDLLDGAPLCVYATGSYGRLEAWKKSDADLFFLVDGANEHDSVPSVRFIEIAARLIQVTRDMEFPPFSGDGMYLEQHNVAKIDAVLGSREDDSINAFTARMLLLLESRPVYDAELYEQLLARVVGFYFDDFPDHPNDFLPHFLTNDILRFWRTLTLNYEAHRRAIRRIEDEAERTEKKAKSALKNYKLKFSRMATCFSMVANLGSSPVPVTPERVLELCDLTPAERFGSVGEVDGVAADLVAKLASQYQEFLEHVQRDESELIAELASSTARSELLAAASGYGQTIYELLDHVVKGERRRFLVV